MPSGYAADQGEFFSTENNRRFRVRSPTASVWSPSQIRELQRSTANVTDANKSNSAVSAAGGTHFRPSQPLRLFRQQCPGSSRTRQTARFQGTRHGSCAASPIMLLEGSLITKAIQSSVSITHDPNQCAWEINSVPVTNTAGQRSRARPPRIR